MTGVRELIKHYNYQHFISENYMLWFRFNEAPRPGDRVENFDLLTLDGAPVSLHKILRRHKQTVIEFGSFT